MMFQLTNTCEACGLYKQCRRPKIGGEEVAHTPSPRVDILFVGSTPSGQDDEGAGIFSDDAGDFLRKFVSQFKGLRIQFTEAVKCWPSEEKFGRIKSRQPSPEEIEFCREYLQEEIEQLRPKIIVCLGAVAMKAVNPHAKSVAQAVVAPIKPETPEGSWILTTYHPINHVTDQRDLRQDYFSLGRNINKILSGTWGTENPDIREASAADMPKVIQQIALSDKIFFDAELNTWTYKNFPYMKTFYMSGRSLTCMGVGTSPKEPVWVLTKEQFDIIAPYFPKKHLIAFNCLFDLAAIDWFYKMPEIWATKLDDPFLMHVSLDQGYMGNSLDALSMKYLGVPSWKKEAYEAMDEENSRRQREMPEFVPATLADIPWPTLVQYNGRDVYYTMLLYELFSNSLPIPASYRDCFMYFVPLLGEVSVGGIRCSKNRLVTAEKIYQQKIDFLLESLQKAPEIRAILGERGEKLFNPRSPVQMTALMTALEVDTGYTACGKYLRADKKTMSDVVQKHCLLRRVMMIKDMQNMLSKFVKPLQYFVDDNSRVHTFYTLGRSESTFNIGGDPTGGVVTGRISARDYPVHNLKNDPILQACLMARPGYTLVKADYNAAEVRGLAWLAGVAALLEMFSKNQDPYLMAISWWDDLTYEDAVANYKSGGAEAKKYRQMVKTAFLAWQYGVGIFKFALTLNCSIERAQKLYNVFEELFPEVHVYQEALLKEAREGNMIITKWGIQRRFNLETSHDENALKNYPTQQTMSHLLLWATEAVRRRRKNRDDFDIINLVHDAGWYEIRDDILDETIKMIVEVMRNPLNLPFELPIKLEVEIKTGKDFGKTERYII